jgi:hypothetical protein
MGRGTQPQQKETYVRLLCFVASRPPGDLCEIVVFCSFKTRRRLMWDCCVLQLQDPPDYRDSSVSGSQEHDRDRVELIKLPSHSSNGTIALNIPSFASSTPETEAPLNLSLKPQQSSSTSSAQKSSLSSLSSLSASLGTPGMTPTVTERTCKPLDPPVACGQVRRRLLNLLTPSPSLSLLSSLLSCPLYNLILLYTLSAFLSSL